MKKRSESCHQLVIAGGNAPKLLQAGKEALHQISVLVLCPIYRARVLAIAELWNHCWVRSTGAKRSKVFDSCHYRFRVVAFVGGDTGYLSVHLGCVCLDSIEQLFCLGTVVHLAARQYEINKVAQAFYRSVNLGREATARPTDSLSSVFLAAPAAC
jgi:hypothetical protein